MAERQQSGGKFRIPVKLIPEDRFAAFDFGTSLLKVVYIRKEDRALLKSAEREDRVNVHVVSFPLDAVEDALDLIVARCLPADDSRSPLVFLATGVESNRNIDTFQKKLGTRVILPFEIDSEAQCIFKLINSLPKEEVVLPLCHESWKAGWDLARSFGAVLGQFDALTVTVSCPHARDKDAGKPTLLPLAKSGMLYKDTDENLFPFFMVMVGSTHCIMEVTSEGKGRVHDICVQGGRSLLGLGSLLTGAQSYDELMSLAEKGDNSKLDLMMNEGFKGNDSETYGSLNKAGNAPRAQWSKCFQTGLENWKKEDLARTLVCMIATDLSTWIIPNAIARGVKRALLFGSMPNHPLMRSEITKSFAYGHTLFPDQLVEVEFITNGSHMGALGALMCDPYPGIEEMPAPASPQ